MPQQGVVKFFNTEKANGFIKPDDGGRDNLRPCDWRVACGLDTLDQGARR